MNRKFVAFCLVLLTFQCLDVVGSQDGKKLSEFEISWTKKTLIVGQSDEILLKLAQSITQPVTIKFEENQPNLIDWSPKSLSVLPNSPNSTFKVKIDAKNAGIVEVTGSASPSNILSDFKLFFKITVGHSYGLIVASVVVGWIYFVLWSIAYYPQIWVNFRRKSVVGLSFDFLALNILGHTLYAIFNASLYFIGYFQDEYFRRFPHSNIPVELNDVFFSSHATLMTALTIFQCFIYERASQRVSYIAWSILAMFAIILIIVAVLCSIGTLHWLDLLYTGSYIKLAVIVKFFPQIVLNYRRKSTVGWSIGSIWLDFTGGFLSILQMFFNSYNYDDWQSNFGNPTKLGVGLFSIFINMVFMVQHYCLYRHPPSDENNENFLDSENSSQ